MVDRSLSARPVNAQRAGFRPYAHLSAPEVLELYVAGLGLAGLPVSRRSRDLETGNAIGSSCPTPVL